jgi:hypothetical protein
VNSGKHDAQSISMEHHPDTCRAGELREQFGVPRPAQPGRGECRLVDGGGRNRVDASGLGIGNGLRDRIVRGTAGLR